MQAQEEYMQQLQKQREQELQLKSLLQQLLSPQALARLNNIRLSNPELYQQFVQLVVMLYQQGRLRGKLSEEQLKALVAKLLEQKKETRIKFVRK